MVKLFVGVGAIAKCGGRLEYVAIAPEYWLVLVMVSGPWATTVAFEPLGITLSERVLVTRLPSAVSEIVSVRKFEPTTEGNPAMAKPFVVVCKARPGGIGPTLPIVREATRRET